MPFTRRDVLTAGAALSGAGLFAGSVDAKVTETSPKPGQTPHTKFAVNIEMWFSKLDFLERIRRSAALGFPSVEFWDWRAKKPFLSKIADLANELDIEIAQFTAWGFSPRMNDPKNKDKFLKSIEEGCAVAHQLHCKKMTVVAGQDMEGVSQEQMHAVVIDALKAAAPIAEANKVMLILEPMNIRVDHKGHCLYGSEKAVRICREVNSPFVKINWDLYHMQISEGDLCRRLEEGFDQVGYLQVADNPGRHEPGTGEVYYPAVLKKAWDLGYRDAVGLECVPKEGEEIAAKRVHEADWK